MEDRIGLDTVVVTEKVVVTDIKMKFWSMVWFTPYGTSRLYPGTD